MRALEASMKAVQESATVLQERVDSYLDDMDEKLEMLLSGMESMSVRRAIERPPIPIPPAPRCLRELSHVRY